MIPVPIGVQVWLATGHTGSSAIRDYRRGGFGWSMTPAADWLPDDIATLKAKLLAERAARAAAEAEARARALLIEKLKFLIAT